MNVSRTIGTFEALEGARRRSLGGRERRRTPLSVQGSADVPLIERDHEALDLEVPSKIVISRRIALDGYRHVAKIIAEDLDASR
jgi:hypothetical protein